VALAALGLLLLVAPLLASRPAHGQAASDGAPAVCRIGINVEDISDIDMAGDTFAASLWIWSVCPSPELAPLEELEFETALPGLNLGPVDTVDLAGGAQYAARRVQGTFRYNWDVTSYPFDRQEVVIPIDEVRYGADRLLFEPDRDQSFLTPDVRGRLDEWRVSDLVLEASVSQEASTYGLPGEGARYARLEVGFTLERVGLLNFLKLTAGVYASVFIAFLSFFYDPNDRGAFGGKLGLLVGVLFAVLVNMRTADTSIGDSGHLTLVTNIHLVTLALIVVLALVALRDRRRSERGLQIRHPDWPTLAVIGGIYGVGVAWMIGRAATS
jgi:hypothetical protein